MLRLLIQDVTLLRREEIDINIRWRGGATSQLRVPVPPSAFDARRTCPSVLESIAAWAEQQTDEEIAARLNGEGMRTGAGQPFTYESVQRLRREKGIPGLKDHLRRAGMRSAEEITERTGIRESTLREWRSRFLQAWPKIEPLGFNDRFRRMWEYYLAYCEVGFRLGTIDVGFFKLAG